MTCALKVNPLILTPKSTIIYPGTEKVVEVVNYRMIVLLSMTSIKSTVIVPGAGATMLDV